MTNEILGEGPGTALKYLSPLGIEMWRIDIEDDGNRYQLTFLNTQTHRTAAREIRSILIKSKEDRIYYELHGIKSKHDPDSDIPDKNIVNVNYIKAEGLEAKIEDKVPIILS